MRERMTNPPDTGIEGDKPDARENDTVVQQGENQHGVPRMPHERDESADQQGQNEPSGDRMAQAARKDVEAGVADTSKAVETDATYAKLREGLPDGEKQFRP